MTETKMEALSQIAQGLFSEEGKMAEFIRAVLQPVMEEELGRRLGAVCWFSVNLASAEKLKHSIDEFSQA